MTTNQAKSLLKAFLDDNNLPYTKLTARTVGFQDLARDKCVFVKVHGWPGSIRWDDVQAFSRGNGFCVEI